MPWISFSSFHDSPCEDRGHTSWVWEKAQWHSLPAVIMALFPVFFGCPCSLQVRARVNKPRRRPTDGWRSDKYTDTIWSTTFEHEGQKRRKDQRIMSQVRLHSTRVFIGFSESKLPLRNSKVMICFYWLEYSLVFNTCLNTYLNRMQPSPLLYTVSLKIHNLRIFCLWVCGRQYVWTL